MKLIIKNMVCSRCEMAVSDILSRLEIPVAAVTLGEIETVDELNAEKMDELNTALKNIGFEILEENSQKLIETVKNLFIQKVAGLDISENFMLSEFVSQQIGRDYSAVSKLFSQTQQMTLEQFFIVQKIEKVKELLFYNEFSLTQIAGMLGYKSVQHLSAQFKTVTGYTPTAFKNLKVNVRKSIDSL